MTDYNQGQIPQLYKKAKERPWRARIESFTLMKRVGDLRGKKLVDAACGEGHFTRRLKQAGADPIVGFDVSERMIELARAQETREPLGIEYRVQDAKTAGSQQDFDLAVSAWLLVYAHNRAELAEMCRGLASWLRPGGRFVTFTTNPELYFFKPLPDYRKYGFDVILADKVAEGAPILWRIYLDDSSLDIENYYLPISAYEAAFKEAGFRDFAVHCPELSAHPAGTDDRAFWADMINYPPAIVMECVRA